MLQHMKNRPGRWLGLPNFLFAVLLAAVLPACTGVGGGGGDEAVVGNNAPQITTLNFTATRNLAFNGQLRAVDPEGGPLTFEAVTQPTSGTLTVQPNGSFVYTPTPNFLGRDQFIARVTDPTGLSSSDTITINVVPAANQAPTLTSTIFTVVQATVLNGQLTGTDPEGGAITFTLTTPTTNGTVTVQPNGAFVYTPVATFTGTDTFQVRLTDPQNASRIGTVTITVTPVPNTAPTITSLQFTLIAGRPYNGQLTATDPENQPITFTRETNPANGTVVVQPNGAFVYTPNAGFTGNDTWIARATDTLGASSTATITMVVTPNATPVAVDDVFDNDGATAFPAYTVISPTEISLNVTANDTDADGDVLTAQVETAVPLFGATAAANAAGEIRVTLPAGFRGLVRLQYRAVDPSNAASNLATVLAFVDTAAFNVAFVGNEFAGTTNELALANLLQPAQRVNGALASGNVTSYVASRNGRTFAYVVDRLNAFYTTAAALGTGTALYTAAATPGSQHQSTAINADGTRICATYFDNGVAPLGAVRSFVADTTAGAPVAVPIDNRPACFQFRANGTDILFLGQNSAAPFDDGIYQAAAATPATLTLLTRPGFYNGFGWQSDKVFLSPDTNRVLFVQERGAQRGVYDLNLAAPATEALLSEEFGLIGNVAASPARDRVAFALPSPPAPPFTLAGYDRASPQTRVSLYTDAAVNADFPSFSLDGARVAYLTTATNALCDTAFGGPLVCNGLLAGFSVDATSQIAYDQTAANLVVAARQGAGDYKLYAVPRPAGGATELTPNNLFIAPGQNFALTADTAVVAVALRESAGGPLRVYLINRAVPGQVLQISGPTSQVERGTVRFIPR
jgi:hypothetical protein